MDPEKVAALRVRYADLGLCEADFCSEPMAQFERWFAETIELGVPEPNAMVLSTVDADGQPSSRHVLLKGVGPDGFVFFTNYGSRKGRELDANPRASLCFPWFFVGRQVVVRGRVSKVTRAETQAYFTTRPRGSQIGAWASAGQSGVVPSREWLDERYAEARARFADAEVVPAPPFWGGYRVTPTSVEFWQGRRNRMHDRLRYRGPDADTSDTDTSAPWVLERLSP